MEITENDIYEEFTKKDIQVIELAESLMKYKIQNIITQLRDSYEYVTSRESIIETINCNDYEFTEDGNIF